MVVLFVENIKQIVYVPNKEEVRGEVMREDIEKILRDLWGLGQLGKTCGMSIEESQEKDVNETYNQILSLIAKNLSEARSLPCASGYSKDVSKDIGYIEHFNFIKGANQMLAKVKEKLGIKKKTLKRR